MTTRTPNMGAFPSQPGPLPFPQKVKTPTIPPPPRRSRRSATPTSWCCPPTRACSPTTASSAWCPKPRSPSAVAVVCALACARVGHPRAPQHTRDPRPTKQNDETRKTEKRKPNQITPGRLRRSTRPTPRLSWPTTRPRTSSCRSRAPSGTARRWRSEEALPRSLALRGPPRGQTADGRVLLVATLGQGTVQRDYSAPTERAAG